MLGFRILLLGEPGSGKTSFIKKLKTGEIMKKYVPTTNYEEFVLNFQTNYATVPLTLCDTVAAREYQTEKNAFTNHFHEGVLVFFDSTQSPKEKQEYIDSINEFIKHLPTLFVENKKDLNEDGMEEDHLIYISCLTGDNLYEPIIRMIRMLFKDESVCLVDYICGICHDEIKITPEKMREYEAELQLAMTLPLPDYDDDL